jgi:hypothetical protein
MKKANSGVSIVGVVVGVFLVAVIAFAVMYFASDVFRTKANAKYKDFSQWTPENIAKDPVNYLNFCEEQTKTAIEKLKASEIAIAQKKGKIEEMRSDADQKITLGNKALDDLKVSYTAADKDNSFPLKWQNAELDKDAAKRQVLKLAGEIKSKTELLKRLDAAVLQLGAQANKVSEARDKAKDQLAKIDTDREMLKVQQITDELKDNLVAMKGAIETSVVGVASAETGSMSLEDLAVKSDTAVDEKEFNKIMGK